MKKIKFLAIFVMAIVLFGCKKESDREKFLGAYQANENCSSGNYNYSMTVIESSVTDDGLVLQNMGNFTPAININATVTGDNLSINDTKDGITITGTGSISGNTLTIIYTAASGGVTDNCTATFIKQ